MAKQNDLMQITKMLKKSLKQGVSHWQEKALEALIHGNKRAREIALKKQKEAITALLALIG